MASSNAYELADALQETEPYYPTDYKLFDNAANMLRQQADRIAELEDRLSFYEIKDLDSGLKPKPLSDEEILEIANGCLVGATAWHNPDLDPIEFARAIEERHGIK